MRWLKKNAGLRLSEVGRVRKLSAESEVNGQETLVFTDQRARDQRESSRWAELLMSYSRLL